MREKADAHGELGCVALYWIKLPQAWVLPLEFLVRLVNKLMSLIEFLNLLIALDCSRRYSPLN
jgi:hypothetical protein